MDRNVLLGLSATFLIWKIANNPFPVNAIVPSVEGKLIRQIDNHEPPQCFLRPSCGSGEGNEQFAGALQRTDFDQFRLILDNFVRGSILQYHEMRSYEY